MKTLPWRWLEGKDIAAAKWWLVLAALPDAPRCPRAPGEARDNRGRDKEGKEKGGRKKSRRLTATVTTAITLGELEVRRMNVLGKSLNMTDTGGVTEFLMIGPNFPTS